MKSRKGAAHGGGTGDARTNTQNPAPKTQNLKEVLIYCDGSSLGNGQEATRAAAVALLGYRGVWRAFGLYLGNATNRSEEHTSELQSLAYLVCRLLLEKQNTYRIFRQEIRGLHWTSHFTTTTHVT